MRKDWDDVANGLRAAALKAIDEAGSLIIALVVDAMLQWAEDKSVRVVVEGALRVLLINFHEVGAFPLIRPTLSCTLITGFLRPSKKQQKSNKKATGEQQTRRQDCVGQAENRSSLITTSSKNDFESLKTPPVTIFWV